VSTFQAPGSVPADRGSFFGEATVSLPRSLATFSMATFLATPAVRKEADESDSTDEKYTHLPTSPPPPFPA